jgi:hypothetical protein
MLSGSLEIMPRAIDPAGTRCSSPKQGRPPLRAAATIYCLWRWHLVVVFISIVFAIVRYNDNKNKTTILDNQL